MIFDETSYSANWTGNFPLSPVEPASQGILLPRMFTHTTLGGLKSVGDRWRFEPGLGGDFELSHSLLLHCGFKLSYANEQVFELLFVEPGVFMGRIPARATPELFAADQDTQSEGDVSFLQEGSLQIALCIQPQERENHFVLCIHEGSRETCLTRIHAFAETLPQRLPALWQSQRTLRQEWVSRIPDNLLSQNPGLAIERLQGLIEPAAGIFQGPWIRNPEAEAPTLSFRLSCTVLSALAVIQPGRVPGLLQTLLTLPATTEGAWAENYSLDAPGAAPALPVFASMLAALPREILNAVDLQSFSIRGQQHIESFLNDPSAEGLPQWPQAEAAFTPEVTDPDSLVQFDLAALLVQEIESLQTLENSHSVLEEPRKNLVSAILDGFWSEKRKRLLDKTPDGEFASRVTAGALIPLLWKRLNKMEDAALRQCLQNPEELRANQGIRQWQPKKEDPIPPPLHPATQQLFLPLLGKLSGEAAALLSADWHRSLLEDPTYAQAETAALQIRLIPYASRINPHLERYPAWVRSMEKHRQSIVFVVAAILFLVPAGFGIYFSVRKDYNRSDEFLAAGAAETLVTMGNFKEAEAAYTRLLTNSRLEGRKGLYYLKRADLRFKEKQYPLALEDYQQAVKLDPRGILYKARWNLGQTYARLGQKPKAIETLQGFIDEYGGELPAYKKRAENAITLWQQ